MTITHYLYDNPYGPTQPVCAECREPLPWPETEGDAYPSGYVCQECEEGIQRDRDANEAFDAITSYVADLIRGSGGTMLALQEANWIELHRRLVAWKLLA